MNNVLAIYNPRSGKHPSQQKLDFLKWKLSKTYKKVDIIKSLDADHLRKIIIQNANKYDLIIICGGDGSFHIALNVIMNLTKKPALGFVPCGTINDIASNYNIPSSFDDAVRCIAKQNFKDVDIFTCNNEYCAYVISTGAYSSLSYDVSAKSKRIFRRLAFYVRAIPMFFKKKRVSGKIITKTNEEIPFNTSFIVILNGVQTGGFKINKGSKLDDGKVEIIVPKPGMFNSLTKFFVKKKDVQFYRSSSFEIRLDNESNWTVDGEKYTSDKIRVNVIHNAIKIACK